MTWTERTASLAVWSVTALAVVFLLTPLAVTVAASFGSSAVFTLPPPGWSAFAGWLSFRRPAPGTAGPSR